MAEGFARRCPIVATTIGAFGYEIENGNEALLIDQADDFASACILLLGNSEFGEALAESLQTIPGSLDVEFIWVHNWQSDSTMHRSQKATGHRMMKCEWSAIRRTHAKQHGFELTFST
jgi:glycosyltransferase involved in cell wall biosynthesis